MKHAKPEAVVVLGGGAPHIALLRHIKKRGLYSILLDYLDNPPAKEFADSHIKKTCLEANIIAEVARSYDVRAILTTHSDGTLPVAASASEALGLEYYLNSKTAASITSKHLMKRIFCDFDIPTADWQVVTAESPSLKSRFDYPLVCKPLNGTGSAGLFIGKDKHSIEKRIQSTIYSADSLGLLVEKFLEGKEYSVDAVIVNGIAEVIAARERKKVFFPERGFVLCHGHIFDREFLNEHQGHLQSIAQKVALGFGLKNSPLMMQLIFSPKNGFNVVEVAARLSGGLTSSYLPKATGIDLLDFSVSCQLNEAPKPFSSADEKMYALQIVYSHSGKIGVFAGFQEALEQDLILDFHLLRRPGDTISEEFSTKSRVAEYVVCGENIDEIFDKVSAVNRRLDILNVDGSSMINRDTRFSICH